MAVTLIVVPCFNVAGYVGATIRSIQAQTFRDWACVVIDDGSTDGTRAAICAAINAHPETARQFEVVHQENRGLSRTRDRGYDIGRAVFGESDSTIFLDSDDVWEPDALERLNGLLEAHPTLGAAAGLCYRVGPSGEFLNRRGRPSSRRSFFTYHGTRAGGVDREVGMLDALDDCPWLNVGQILVRSSVLNMMRERDGWLFEPQITFAEDMDWLLRFHIASSLWLTGAFVLGYRLRPGQGTQRQRGEAPAWNEMLMRRTPSYLRAHLEFTRDFLEFTRERVAQGGAES